MQLRPATMDDLSLLQYWDTQPHVIAASPNDTWSWEEDLRETPPWREQLIAEVNDIPIGVLQIIDPALEETHYWGKVPPHLRAIDIWIGEASYLGQGYGTQMMHLAIARCFATATVTGILVDPLASNTRVHRFYERLGFKAIDRRQFGQDDCLIYHLNRTDYQPPPSQQNLLTGR